MHPLPIGGSSTTSPVLVAILILLPHVLSLSLFIPPEQELLEVLHNLHTWFSADACRWQLEGFIHEGWEKNIPKRRGVQDEPAWSIKKLCRFKSLAETPSARRTQVPHRPWPSQTSKDDETKTVAVHRKC
ncbi:hypothetical protein BD309DRAFT_963026 [Dichomitus squalens]|uniref:Uncharacterized protein n=1 Tax=Dichomitus squalens TaxID=114155 RepID=A0A4Q9Q3E5_9APHY|nr:hypothetical protein BD309DRAFT_963026 [Dichomitus squalens]TBU61406.1 hypothetical protein BD310DRAFT_920699 [Dichomitus squalens]